MVIESVSQTWKKVFADIQKKAFKMNMEKPLPSKWIEENIYLPEGVSRYKGRFSYDLSPYAREIVDRLYTGDPSRAVAVMKGAQTGITQGVIVPGMVYIISEDPAPQLFMAADKELAKKSIEERFDPIMSSSNLQYLIRPSVIRAKNQRTGDTSLSKEYAGGRLTIEGTINVNKLRQISVRNIWADDWDAAPKANKKEGSTRKLAEGRQTSYGNLAKTFYISTPTTKGDSNIEEVYELGDQRKWNWECPHCSGWFPMEWRVKLNENDYAGIVYQLNEKKQLINESVKYKCPHCSELINESQKYELNLKGKWVPTAEPVIENYYSYHLSSLVAPAGFITWVDLVKEWLEACPPDLPVDQSKLKTFLNIRLGQTWEEKGEIPEVMLLMNNIRNYPPGEVPDVLVDEDQNGHICMLSFACDLNGIMERDLKDVRLDWEILAHSTGGQTYSVDHGSIGTFKKLRDMKAQERKEDASRDRWTAEHGQMNSIWDEVEELLNKEWVCSSGRTRTIDIAVFDTGFASKYVNQFVTDYDGDALCYGVKGSSEGEYRNIHKDTKPVVRSRESKNLYIVQGNQLKDELSHYMKLRIGDNDLQPDGFMNYPLQIEGKYTLPGYFRHYEGEHRKEVIKNGEVVGYAWGKKSSNAPNHFWDVRVYGLAARDIFIDALRQANSKNKDLTWDIYRGWFHKK